jgi:murein DD-endopeptidase MepM/ murein hydrolase activator NlpD
LFKVIIIMILLLFISPLVYAEDGSILMQKYGIPVNNPVVESEKLNIMVEAYNEVAHEVNSNTMLSAAYDLFDQYSKNKLTSMDSEIYVLTDKLNAIEALMDKSKEKEVAYIMDLDSKYRSVMAELKVKRQLRNLWVEQTKAVSKVPEINTDEDRLRMNALGNQVDAQRDKYQDAISYPDLGDIKNFVSPLSLPAIVNSPFGARLDPVKRDSVTFHKGMDLNAPIGTVVLAAFNGIIEEAASNAEIGNYVIINHGHGIKTLYGHLNHYQVNKDQKVIQYQPIAESGNSGTETTGPHLHFGVFINGTAVDPGVFVPH